MSFYNSADAINQDEPATLDVILVGWASPQKKANGGEADVVSKIEGILTTNGHSIQAPTRTLVCVLLRSLQIIRAFY